MMNSFEKRVSDGEHDGLHSHAIEIFQVNLGLNCNLSAWDGTLHDGDFNLAPGMSMNHGAPDHISRFDPEQVRCRRVVTGNHCFGCTAGFGSSCAGALA